MTHADLRKIIEAMTPGPWTWEPSRTAAGTPYQHVRARHVGVCDTYHDDPIYFPGGSPFATPESLDADGDEWVSSRHGNAHDATGIAALRNHAEALLDVVSTAKDVIAWLEHTEASVERYRAMRAAIARLEEVKP